MNDSSVRLAGTSLHFLMNFEQLPAYPGSVSEKRRQSQYFTLSVLVLRHPPSLFERSLELMESSMDSYKYRSP